MKKLYWCCLILLGFSQCHCFLAKKNDHNSIIKADNIATIIISFESIGTGIDEELLHKIDTFILSYEEENNLTIDIRKHYLGKEGETDYCFMLENLEQSLRVDLTDRLKKMCAGYKYTFVYENVACKGAR